MDGLRLSFHGKPSHQRPQARGQLLANRPPPPPPHPNLFVDTRNAEDESSHSICKAPMYLVFWGPTDPLLFHHFSTPDIGMPPPGGGWRLRWSSDVDPPLPPRGRLESMGAEGARRSTGNKAPEGNFRPFGTPTLLLTPTLTRTPPPPPRAAPPRAGQQSVGVRGVHVHTWSGT